MSATQAISIATTNLAVERLQSVTWAAEDYTEFIDDANYDGLELHPVRSRLKHQALHGVERAGDIITSFHQSFRAESATDMIRFAVADRAELKRCLPAFVALPPANHSLNHLARIQANYPAPKHTVVFPDKLGVDRPNGLQSLLVQPKPELLHVWGLDSDEATIAVSGLAQAFKDRGFGICLDLVHWGETSNDGYTLPHWQTAFPSLMQSGLVKEIHIGPNRSDTYANDEGRQLRRILSGKLAGTLLGRQLLLLRDSATADFPPCVIEMTANQARAANNPLAGHGNTSQQTNLVDINRDLTAAIRQLVSQ